MSASVREAGERGPGGGVSEQAQGMEGGREGGREGWREGRGGTNDEPFCFSCTAKGGIDQPHAGQTLDLPQILNTCVLQAAQQLLQRAAATHEVKVKTAPCFGFSCHAR